MTFKVRYLLNNKSINSQFVLSEEVSGKVAVVASIWVMEAWSFIFDIYYWTLK